MLFFLHQIICYFHSFSDEEDLCSSQLSMNGIGDTSNHTTAADSSSVHWQKRLESAQNVLFCKELFSQLAREAVMLNMDIPPLVVADQIIATIFPGIHLVISLYHSTPSRCVFDEVLGMAVQVYSNII